MRWWSRIRCAAAVVAVFCFAVPVLAQSESPEDMYVDLGTEQEARAFQSLREFSSFGGSIGFMKLSGGDLGPRYEMRPVLQGVFRYRFSENWVGLGDFGFGWNSFTDGGDTVLAVTMGTLGVARTLTNRFGVDFRGTGGAGFYRWNYKFNGKSLRDPQTHLFYRGISPGGFVGLEGERRLTRHVTLTGMLQQHFVFTADQDKYQSNFDDNHRFLSFRTGVHYHFSPYEGILWESTSRRTIRLESGKEGK